jgi:apolipoprotein N-acyltransferase
MRNLPTLLHATTAVIAFALFGVEFAGIDLPRHDRLILFGATPTFALTAFVSGLIAMALRKGESERIWLAVTTIAALLALILSAGAIGFSA